MNIFNKYKIFDLHKLQNIIVIISNFIYSCNNALIVSVYADFQRYAHKFLLNDFIKYTNTKLRNVYVTYLSYLKSTTYEYCLSVILCLKINFALFLSVKKLYQNTCQICI